MTQDRNMSKVVQFILKFKGQVNRLNRKYTQSRGKLPPAGLEVLSILCLKRSAPLEEDNNVKPLCQITTIIDRKLHHRK